MQLEQAAYISCGEGLWVDGSVYFNLRLVSPAKLVIYFIYGPQARLDLVSYEQVPCVEAEANNFFISD